MPILARGASKQQHERLRKDLEVIVPVDGALRVELDVAEHLHTYDGVDEEEHGDEQTYVGQRLERLYERPEQDADRVALTEQLDETSGAKQTQEAQVDRRLFVYALMRVVGVRIRTRRLRFDVALHLAHFGDDDVEDTADHRDEVEYVPRVAEVVLKILN